MYIMYRMYIPVHCWYNTSVWFFRFQHLPTRGRLEMLCFSSCFECSPSWTSAQLTSEPTDQRISQDEKRHEWTQITIRLTVFIYVTTELNVAPLNTHWQVKSKFHERTDDRAIRLVFFSLFEWKVPLLCLRTAWTQYYYGLETLPKQKHLFDT